ncbi:hypothetical protein ATO12_03510 [Aquimarina atlantica]|uniref:Uncharacterized protein n=1 Tax=Aquimarina atlantica TaxID=1317122 RepID=A0A023C0S1_9FLAO|nr:hypothetical protein ATO12_03510 [Aquimarina atlantica]
MIDWESFWINIYAGSIYFILGIFVSLWLIPKFTIKLLKRKNILNGVSLKTAMQFDPASGYSIVLITILLFLTFLLIYFNKTQNHIKQHVL